jgi:hypothetical protein
VALEGALNFEKLAVSLVVGQYAKPLTTKGTKVHEGNLETKAFVLLRVLGGSCFFVGDIGAQLLDDLQSGFVGGFNLVDIERDCPNAGVATAAVALADSG